MITIHEFEETGVKVFQPDARLTIENAHELLKLIRLISTPFAPLVVVNLQHTKMLDSTGVGALVSSMKHIRLLNGRFALASLSPDLQHMFQLMNLYQVFEIYDSVDSATVQLTSRTT